MPYLGMKWVQKCPLHELKLISLLATFLESLLFINMMATMAELKCKLYEYF